MFQYNPKDCWHNPYFIYTENWWIIKNPNCVLTEKDYERLFVIKWDEKME
jgi:hypothetical protein